MRLTIFQNYKFIGAGLFIVLMTSCTEISVRPDIKENFYGRAVIIINEGNYASGNASLSCYKPDSMQISNNIFLSKNDFPVGDVPQSLIIRDSLAFMTVSNSGKILIFHTGTLQHSGTIAGLSAPRYMEFISDSLAIVSDLYEKNMTIVNVHTHSISRRIPVGGTTEQIIVLDDHVYAASWSFNNKLYKISLDEMRVTDSLTTGIQPNSMVSDRDGNLWVLCDGGYPGNFAGHENARLLKIDPASLSVSRSYIFSDLSASPTELSINSTKDSLFYLGGSWGGESSSSGIYQMPLDAGQLPQEAFISGKSRLFYGLGIDPHNSDIYCSDAIDYLQRGIAFRYNSSGEKIDSFSTGVIPGFFAFTE